ncbi:MAG: hypothetical protein OQJ97_09015 [Rhodospirillales bacterium]|nr:hypothetical protein [Rhodospirillales bacterium]
MFTPLPSYLHKIKSTNVRNLFVLLKNAFKIWRQRTTSRRVMTKYDSRTLADVGIAQNLAEFETAQPFWKPPSVLGRDALPEQELGEGQHSVEAVLIPLSNYETVHTKKGRPLLVRPMTLTDKGYVVDLFNHSSAESRYNRFFRPVRYLSEKELERETSIDRDLHLGWIGFIQEADQLRCVGVVHIARDNLECDQWEFSVSVQDSDHSCGIGAALLSHAAHEGQKMGIDTFYGHVLEKNKPMLAYVKHRGATLKRDYPGIYRFQLPTGAMM